MVQHFFIFIFFSIFTFQVAASQEKLKITLNVYNQVGSLRNSTIFIYNQNKLIGHHKVNSDGLLSVKIDKNQEYLFVISSPGHITSRVTLSTHKMYADQLNKVYLECQLYHVSNKTVNMANVNYKVKWNPIIERFEYFSNNWGWIDEIKMQQGLK